MGSSLLHVKLQIDIQIIDPGSNIKISLKRKKKGNNNRHVGLYQAVRNIHEISEEEEKMGIK